MTISTIDHIGAALFALAVLHTFSTRFFEHLAHRQPRHAGIWHLLGEVEVVFGFWALILVLFIAVKDSAAAAIAYLEGRDFTEPLFVFVIMIMAATRPVMVLAQRCIGVLARLLPLSAGISHYWVIMALVPLLGSAITEPAAMTMAALMLSQRYFGRGISTRLKYASLGTLFVNVSIGGVLTPYAAPPVLMVASTWGWDLAYTFSHFGWKAMLAVLCNATLVAVLFRRELGALDIQATGGAHDCAPRMPLLVSLIHLLFMALVVVFAHHAVVFMGLFLFFLGYTEAYKKFQSPLMLREGLLVAFFLCGLVVLGGMQKWWLQDVLAGMSDVALYFGATALTAITDNAALTYLGSLVEGTSEGFRYALVAGAVTGGGLTVIANAPNPAGYAILRQHFEDGAISALWLLLAALPPTLVAIAAFQLL